MAKRHAKTHFYIDFASTITGSTDKVHLKNIYMQRYLDATG